MKAKDIYYADLNPAYPSKGQLRYCVFMRPDRLRIKPETYARLKQAEKQAAKFNALLGAA